jgi:hypothetical protein
MDRTVLYVVFGAYIAWRVYRRMKLNIGRQPLRPRRIIFRLVMICLACLFIPVVLHQYPLALAGFGGGLLCGALLGFVGLRLTKFETTEQGHFYIPDTRMGVGISLLLTGRIIYRLIVPPNFTLIPGHPPPQFSPLTFFLAGITLGYFLVYLIGLVVHTHDKKPLPTGDSL